MAQTDTVDKIVGSYFAAVAAEPFEYKGKDYEPRALRVSPGLFRGFTCPVACGACCPRFSLDYLPSEADKGLRQRLGLKKRVLTFSGRQVKLYSDLQSDRDGYFCRHLKMDTGRCGLFRESTEEGAGGNQPFSCDFELVRFMITKADGKLNQMNTRLFGRGWALKRIDGERGAQCKITEESKENIPGLLRRLHALKAWCEHFGLVHHVDAIIKWVETGPHDWPLILSDAIPGKKVGFFV